MMLRRIAMAIGGTVVVALILTLTVPRAAHAVLSALVTVTNTASNPVPVQSVDDHALHAFQETGFCDNGPACQAQGFFSVPLGMTAVVQDVSGSCDFFANSTSNFAPPPTSVVLKSTNDAAAPDATAVNPSGVASVELQAVFEGTLGSSVSGNTFYTFGRPITLYAASPSGGPQATFTFIVDGPTNFNAECIIHISGYYVKNGL